MAATQSVTLTAVPPDRLADSLGLAPGDRQVGDVLTLSNSDALALIRAGVGKYSDRAGTPSTNPGGSPVEITTDPLVLAVQQATRDAVIAVRAAAEAELAILNRRTTPLGGAHLVSGSSQRLRENFVAVDDWAITTTGGASAPQYALAGGVMTVTMGATPNAELVLTSKFRVTAPARALVFHAMSQKVANQSFSFELIADDDEDPAVLDELTVAAWRFAGSDSTTSTVGRYDVNNGLPSRLVSGNVTVTDHVGTAPKAIHEIQLESDECRWFSRAIDSLSTRGASFVRQMVSPDPSRLYRVRMRFTNGATAPTNGTTMTVGGVVVQDYTEIVTEIASSRGSSTVDESVPTQVLNTPNVAVTNNPTLSNIANDVLVTSTALAANANTAHTAVDENTNLNFRGNRLRLTVQATAAALGALMHVALEESEDGTTYRETWRTPLPVDGLAHTFDMAIRSRYWRARSINGATALTGYFLKARTVRMDGAADIDKVLTFPLTPGAGSALVTAAGGTYVSATLDLGGNHLWDKIRVLGRSDQASASNGFYIEQSIDGANWFTTVSATLTAATPALLETPVVGRYLRVGLINGATVATLQRLIATLVSL